MQKKELLIPVGSFDVLYAAIHAGADAVYLAYKKYGARAYASNFSLEEIIEAIKICHLYNVKVYVTVNTMILNNEIDDCLNILKELYINNVDAVIMQDNGLIKLVRQVIPELNIHVSTQAHNHNYEGISYYKDLGCTRVVFDRESSLEMINKINVDIEKEIFIYGALCVCYSGNCLFSALNGGRSANRGMCVGSCRLPYYLEKNKNKLPQKYYLSTKDLNTLDNLKEILDSDVTSLKIEGRMKSKEYVTLVTSIYRRLIDDYYNGKELIITDNERKDLLKTYNREFTKGYLFKADNIINNKTSNHQGIVIGKVIGVNNRRITIKLSDDLHQEDAIRFSNTKTGMYVNTLYNDKDLLTNEVKKGSICQIDNKDRIMYDDLINSDVLKTIDYLLNKRLNEIPLKRIPLTMKFKALLGYPLSLEVSSLGKKIEVNYGTAEKALNLPVSNEKIKEQLSKLGNTIYKLDNIEITMDNNLFINLKDLNELRRRAILELNEIRCEDKKKDFNLIKPKERLEKASVFKYSILVRTEEQLQISLRNNMDYIYVTNIDLYNKYKTYSNVFYRLGRVNEREEDYHNERLLCTELGSLVKFGKDNIVHTDYPLNIANGYSIEAYNDLNSKINTLSVELSKEDINNIKDTSNSEVILYGRLELMIIKNNIFNINNDDVVYLCDKNNNKYPIRFKDNITYIYNCKVINRIKEKKLLKGVQVLRIDLFDENILETQRLINEIKA